MMEQALALDSTLWFIVFVLILWLTGIMIQLERIHNTLKDTAKLEEG